MTEPLNALSRDLRLALRGMRLRPGFALTVVLIVALGVGGNTAIFSFVRGVLLRPLGYAQPDRLFALWEDRTARNGPAEEWTGQATLAEWRARQRSLSGLAASMGQAVTLTEGDTPRPLRVGRVTSSYFDVLGVSPILGRAFRDAEGVKGSSAVMVLGQELWRSEFHSAPDVIGRVVSIDGKAVTVVGVAPPGLQDPFSGALDAWLAFEIDPAATDYGDSYLRVIARLAPGVEVAAARADLARVAREVGEAHPIEYREVGIAVQPLSEAVTGSARQPLLVLSAAVGAVMLLVCANVAGLLLARGAGRGREVALRRALGASRLGLVRQMMVESLALAAIGGGLGLLIGRWSIGAMQLAASDLGMPRVEEVTLDGAVLLFTASAVLLSALLFGLLPALLQSGDGASGGGGSRTVTASGRVRRGLVVAEMALALALFVGAGLLVRSLISLARIDPGFKAESVSTGRVRMPEGLIADLAGLRTTVDHALATLATQPQVRSAGAVSTLPMSGAEEDINFRVEGRATEPGKEPSAQLRVATPGYFSVLDIPLLSGRLFSESDDAAAPRVVLVNAELARQLFGNRNPIGQRLQVGEMRNPEPKWRTVIGVVGGVRDRSLSQTPQPEVLLPFAQQPRRTMTLVVRAAGDVQTVTPLLRRAIAGADPRLAMSTPQALTRVVERTLGLPRLLAALLGAFAGLAGLLAGLGVYGVMAQAVSERRREFGVRLALGAAPGDLLRLILRQSTRLAALGVGIGLLAAGALGAVMSSQLFGVQAGDPVSWSAAVLVLLLAVLAASLLPALRAAAVEPAEALRQE